MPPNHAHQSPVRGPVPPPAPQNESQSGVPKFVEASAQLPEKAPASKLPSVTALDVHSVPSPW
jgi:hypothetical protein